MNRMKAIFLALGAALILKLFVFDFIIAQGHSMEPAIQNGTILIVSRLRYGFRPPWMQRYLIMWSRPRQGEVLVFYTPLGELAVKRVVSVTENGFYAKGDNELASLDSRSYGSVPFNNIRGKVLGK